MHDSCARPAPRRSTHQRCARHAMHRAEGLSHKLERPQLDVFVLVRKKLHDGDDALQSLQVLLVLGGTAEYLHEVGAALNHLVVRCRGVEDLDVAEDHLFGSLALLLAVGDTELRLSHNVV